MDASWLKSIISRCAKGQSMGGGFRNSAPSAACARSCGHVRAFVHDQAGCGLFPRACRSGLRRNIHENRNNCVQAPFLFDL